MLNGQTELTDCFLHRDTLQVTCQLCGTGQALQPQGLQEKRSSVPVFHSKNNFRKNCRLLTKSPKNLNTMLSLCKYYNIYNRSERYVGTIPL